MLAPGVPSWAVRQTPRSPTEAATKPCAVEVPTTWRAPTLAGPDREPSEEEPRLPGRTCSDRLGCPERRPWRDSSAPTCADVPAHLRPVVHPAWTSGAPRAGRSRIAKTELQIEKRGRRKRRRPTPPRSIESGNDAAPDADRRHARRVSTRRRPPGEGRG